MFLAFRRLFSALGLILLAFAPSVLRAEEVAVTLRLDPTNVLAQVPPDFLGFGYESAAIARPGYFNVDDRVLVQLYQTLSPHGTIRVGGNVSDHTIYSPDATPAPNPESQTTVVNRANLFDFGAFLRATGWQAIWGLNLGTGSKEDAAREAVAVSEALGERLLCFQIGNETDLLPRFHKDYDAYLTAFREYRAAILAVLPEAKFSGPDVAWNTAWAVRFAHDEGSQIHDLTAHYYRGGANQPVATLSNLLATDTAWQNRTLLPLQAACSHQPFGYRLTEVNSFFGGGKAGVSDTFGSALWCLDYLLDCAGHGCAGVNLETDVNHLGWVSHYSPIFRDAATDALHARPEYYAMLAFRLAGQGSLCKAALEPSTALNLTVYAARQPAKDTGNDTLWLTLINKDLNADAKVACPLPAGFISAECGRLQAPSAESKEGVTLLGAAVTPDGHWTAFAKPELLAVKGGQITVSVPHASAALVQLRP